ncbi:MAG TPA: hypothetical protein VNN77_07055 [candidate division Zixibacteria bacterium]|nr:hypothetical protein [candidate division Zixibacteria bacterium]
MTRADASPLMPEELEQLVRTIPRESKDVRLYNALAGPDHLPER